MKPLIKEAKSQGISLLLLPHGLLLGVNDLLTNKAVFMCKNQNYGEDWRDFDFSCTQFPLHKDRITKNGFSKERVRVLGSARFCNEWRKVLAEIKPGNRYYHDSGGSVNVVYMDHRLEYRFKKNTVIESISRLDALECINLVVKPTTGRTHKSTPGDELGVLTRDNCPGVTFADNYPSDSLIEWADVVICTISSIGIEALLQDKLLIHPQYFHENALLYDEMNACWTVNSYQELEDAMQKTRIDASYRPYSKENVDQFIKYVVYGGRKNRDVLGDYKDFILSKAQLN